MRPGGDPIPGTPASGQRGWWYGDTSHVAVGKHYLITSATMYLALRRNTTGMDQVPVEPVALEHKVFPTTASIDGSEGGGLLPTEWYPWIDETMSAGAIRVTSQWMEPGLFPDLDASWSNFWGEIIGGVTLYQGMYDIADALPGSPGFQPLQPVSGLGGALAAFFGAWRTPAGWGPGYTQSNWNLGVDGGIPPAGTGTPECSCEWAASPPAPDEPVLVPDVVTGPFGLLSAVPGQGQNWDCSLHVFARAIQTLFHVGYTFTWADRIPILTRVHFWREVACQDIDTLTARLLAAQAKGGVDRYGPTTNMGPNFPAPTSLTCGTNSHRAPQLDNTLEAIMSMVYSGVFSPPSSSVLYIFYGWGLALARGLLRTYAVGYRTSSPQGFGVPGHRWRNEDELAAPVGGGATPQAVSREARLGLGGTFNAIVGLFMLATQEAYPDCANSSGLSAAQASLGSFFSIFATSPLSTVAHPAWGGDYDGE